MRLFVLDCSTHVGWAFFKACGAMPTFDTWHAPRGVDRDDFGAPWVAFEVWLACKLDELAPDVLGFEAPLLPRNKTFQKTRAIRMSWGFATVVETTARKRGLRCIECHPSTVKKRLAGHGKADKDAMIVAAIRAGWLVADDNQADALGVGLVTYDHVGLGT